MALATGAVGREPWCEGTPRRLSLESDDQPRFRLKSPSASYSGGDDLLRRPVWCVNHSAYYESPLAELEVPAVVSPSPIC